MWISRIWNYFLGEMSPPTGITSEEKDTALLKEMRSWTSKKQI